MRRVEAWTTGVSDRQLLIWSVLALVNLASAFAVFRTTDFDTMHVWTSEWLWHGENLYAGATWATDYPPNAVVVLSPVALLPAGAAAWVWALLNVGLVAIAGVLTARATRADAPARSVWLLVATLFCWSATRTLLQFSLLALVFALAAWRWSTRLPRASGVLLGLALMKPQVALPYVVWMVVMRRWQVMLTALTTTGMLWAIYCLRVGASPVAVAAHYVRTLLMMYSGRHAQVGVSELARLAPTGQEGIWTVLTALTLAVMIGTVVMKIVRTSRTQVGRHASPLPGAIAAAVLVTFRHLSYSFVSLLPAAAWLLLADGRRGSWMRRLFWLLQAGLVVDLPTLHRVMQAFGWSNPVADQILPHADRMGLVLWTLVLLTLTWRSAAGLPGRHDDGGGGQLDDRDPSVRKPAA